MANNFIVSPPYPFSTTTVSSVVRTVAQPVVITSTASIIETELRKKD